MEVGRNLKKNAMNAMHESSVEEGQTPVPRSASRMPCMLQKCAITSHTGLVLGFHISILSEARFAECTCLSCTICQQQHDLSHKTFRCSWHRGGLLLLLFGDICA